MKIGIISEKQRTFKLRDILTNKYLFEKLAQKAKYKYVFSFFFFQIGSSPYTSSCIFNNILIVNLFTYKYTNYYYYYLFLSFIT